MFLPDDLAPLTLQEPDKSFTKQGGVVDHQHCGRGITAAGSPRSGRRGVVTTGWVDPLGGEEMVNPSLTTTKCSLMSVRLCPGTILAPPGSRSTTETQRSRPTANSTITSARGVYLTAFPTVP